MAHYSNAGNLLEQYISGIYCQDGIGLIKKDKAVFRCNLKFVEGKELAKGYKALEAAYT
ncbi:37041_t:CDS:2, partial [Gigaspora margarita]